MSKAIQKSIQYGEHLLTISTGEIARQAHGAVVVSYGDTTVLVTVVGNKEVKEGQDFFPLTVDYQERTYAAGKIPGGFFKREGRPSEKEILTCRLIDRPLRPLFPEFFYNEIQVVATVLSLDPEIDADIPSIIGASAAMALSGIPFYGPLGAVRVGFIDDQFVLNPRRSLMTSSKLDMVVAATAQAVMMVESEANELSEDIMLGAVDFGFKQMQVVIQLINELAAEVANPPWDWKPASDTFNAVLGNVASIVSQDIVNAYKVKSKGARTEKLNVIRKNILDKLATADTSKSELNEIRMAIQGIESKIVREQILKGESRIDGRDTKTVRPITIKTGVLPRAHGSSLFTRGETQALVVSTLGTGKDEQMIDALGGTYNDRFMFHYNMPPYATGETGRVGSPKRREIGHGRLAKRSLIPVLPTDDEFSYVIRVVSEITESNGSSSMASVCGASLALMDAGVPIKTHVAGVAMGLIKEGNRVAILTDILGDEDHLGDMDFKVAGTKDGITALQMDIKISGITPDIMKLALLQAKEGRLSILNLMHEAIPTHRSGLSKFAPRILTMKIHPDKIRDVIGKGGAVIRSITEDTGAIIDIDDDGTIKIASVSLDSGEAAKRRIEELTIEILPGDIYDGTVIKMLDFGAIVSLCPGKEGLVHISQIAHQRINAISDFLHEGQQVKVKVLEADDKGRIRLSMRALIPAPEPEKTE